MPNNVGLEHDSRRLASSTERRDVLILERYMALSLVGKYVSTALLQRWL